MCACAGRCVYSQVCSVWGLGSCESEVSGSQGPGHEATVGGMGSRARKVLGGSSPASLSPGLSPRQTAGRGLGVPSSTCPGLQAEPPKVLGKVGCLWGPPSLKTPPQGLLPGGAGFFPRTHDSLLLGPFHFCFGAKNTDTKESWRGGLPTRCTMPPAAHSADAGSNGGPGCS